MPGLTYYLADIRKRSDFELIVYDRSEKYVAAKMLPERLALIVYKRRQDLYTCVVLNYRTLLPELFVEYPVYFRVKILPDKLSVVTSQHVLNLKDFVKEFTQVMSQLKKTDTKTVIDVKYRGGEVELPTFGRVTLRHLQTATQELELIKKILNASYKLFTEYLA